MVEVWSVDVTLLHAIDEERWLGGRPELERLMRRMKAIAGDGPQARYFGFRLERGQPAVRILEYVRAHPIDLVVIPAGGTSRPVGSVADQVLAEASCPVWLDWGAVRCRATTGMDARRVYCALELGECDETVLAKAAKMAAELGAELSLIHALPPTAGKPPVYLGEVGIRSGRWQAPYGVSMGFATDSRHRRRRSLRSVRVRRWSAGPCKVGTPACWLPATAGKRF
jgi:hypothetical protein